MEMKGEAEITAAVPEPVIVTRFYESRDRAVVRRICAETGFLGKPVDPIFEDRELFADYLTQYYTDLEPASTLVLEVDGHVVGYLNGSRQIAKYRRYRAINNLLLGLRGMYRCFTRPYNAGTRQYVRWLLMNASRQSPVVPPHTPHFHINLLSPARKVAHARALIDAFLRYLVASGEKAVYAQVIAFDKRRGPRIFERYGFRVIDRKTVTKYRHLHAEPVYLFTILKDLTRNERLYGDDLHKATDAS